MPSLLDCQSLSTPAGSQTREPQPRGRSHQTQIAWNLREVAFVLSCRQSKICIKAIGPVETTGKRPPYAAGTSTRLMTPSPPNLDQHHPNPHQPDTQPNPQSRSPHPIPETQQPPQRQPDH